MAWAALTTKPTSYSLAKAINHSRARKGPAVLLYGTCEKALPSLPQFDLMVSKTPIYVFTPLLPLYFGIESASEQGI